jgi:O-antigen/teichoic acid export membrane protein
MGARESESDVVKTTGRGVLYITFAKGWFLLAGMVLTFGLPRIFKWAGGDDVNVGIALFGAYQIVTRGVSIINNGIVTGTIQAVSKFTSEDESNAGAVRRAGLRVQGSLGIAIAVLYAALAGFLAQALGSPELATPMRITAGIIAAYSCYAVFIGSFNGRRLFSHQATFDITYATLKTGLIIGLAAAGFGILGAVSGFLAAAVLITIIAAFVARPQSTGIFPAKKYLTFGATLIVYTFLLNLVLSLDLWLLKGLTTRAAIESGQTVEIASLTTKVLAGQYSAAQGLAFIPYQAILSIAFVAFPLISKVTFSGDTEKAKIYVQKTMRFTAIFIVGLAAVFCALPSQTIGFIFPTEYLVATEALGILSIGIAAFGLLVVSNTILNGAGLPGKAMLAVVLTLAVIIGGVSVLVSQAGSGPGALAAAATGSASGMTLGLIISGVLVYRRFGAFCPWGTALRVLAAGTVSIAAGRMLLPNGGRILTLCECAAVLAIYFVCLFVLREFNRTDWTELRRVLKRG